MGVAEGALFLEQEADFVFKIRAQWCGNVGVFGVAFAGGKTGVVEEHFGEGAIATGAEGVVVGAYGGEGAVFFAFGFVGLAVALETAVFDEVDEDAGPLVRG